LKSGFYSSGHPRVENGKRPEENHVSNTSSSCLSSILSGLTLNFLAALSLASYSFLPTT
jgi:hypothetical protein